MNDVPKAPSPFDEVAWREQLLELNPWARGVSIDERDESFAAARQEATLARRAQGKAAWNDWARAMLALKAAMVEEGANAETRFWLALATAAFSTQARRHTFEGDARFDELVFAGPASFEDATFTGEASFAGATFSTAARFEGATFSAAARFRRAIFSSVAFFHPRASSTPPGSRAQPSPPTPGSWTRPSTPPPGSETRLSRVRRT